MNKITEITRRNIFDSLNVEKLGLYGRLGELDFLSRVFDLQTMPSQDTRFSNAYGDIFQHTVNNNDWESDWIFFDERFNLLKCDDSIFLQFLCEMIHPIVRPDLTQVNKIKQIFNDYLSQDGFEIIEKTQISGKPVFAARQKLSTDVALFKKKEAILNALTEEYVSQQINLMETSINSAPHVAIGVAKELVETICKAILSERKAKTDNAWDLPKLLKETNKQLKLTPEDVPDKARAAETIRGILGSLSNVVQGICELRNPYGTGHGKHPKFRGLSPRHAKLAVGAAETLAIFLLETNKIR